MDDLVMDLEIQKPASFDADAMRVAAEAASSLMKVIAS